MRLIWWILPALAGVVGVLVTFAGLGKLMRLRMLSGASRLFFGAGFLGLAGVTTFAGLNLQTYKRLTYERPVAELSFAEATDEASVTASLKLEGDEQPLYFTLMGDEFEIGARVIKFKPLANMLGFDSLYKLDFIEGRLARRFSSAAVSEATTTGVALSDDPGFDVHKLVRENGGPAGFDATYGSAVYNPMAPGLAYTIWMTQDALIARPANAETRRRLGLRAPAAETNETPAGGL